MSYDITTYLNSTSFMDHPMGNYSLYGLNSFGCDSIIRCNDEIMKFYAFQTGTRNAIYITKNGTEHIINPYDSSLNITRLVDINDMTNFTKSTI
jgi:hypothetical protein